MIPGEGAIPVRRRSQQFSLSGLAALSMLGQLIIQVEIARRFGARAVVDGFVVAVSFTVFFVTLLAGSFTYLLIPTLARLSSHDRQSARNLRNNVISLIVTGSAVIGLLEFLAAPRLAVVLAPGLQEQATRGLVSELRLLGVALPVIVFAELATAVRYSENRFVQMAALIAVAPLAGLVVLVTGAGHETTTLALVFIGPFALRAFWLGLTSEWMIVCPRFTSEERNLFHSYRPLAGVGLYTEAERLVDPFVASGIGPGSVAQFGYSQRAITSIIRVVQTGAGHTLLHDAAGANRKDRSTLVASALRRSIVPATAFGGAWVVFGPQLLNVAARNAALTQSDARHIQTAVIWLLPMLAAALYGAALTNGFFSSGNSRTPAAIGMVAISLGYMAKPIGAGLAGLSGLVMATSGWYMLQALLLRRAWNRGLDREYRAAIDRSGLSLVLFAAIIPVGLHVSGAAATMTLAAQTGSLAALLAGAAVATAWSHR